MIYGSGCAGYRQSPGRETEGSDRVCLIEFPHPSIFGSLALAEGSGWVSVYDIVDDWEAFYSVGQAPWYDPAFERHLVAASDVVTAVSARLAEKHAEARKAPIPIIPNGYSPDLGLGNPFPEERSLSATLATWLTRGLTGSL